MRGLSGGIPSPFPGQGRGMGPAQATTGPQPNAQAFAHANEHAAFMRPQFPGGGMGLMPGRAMTDLPPHLQGLLSQRWGMFGGGQPMPSTFGGYRDALQNYRQANPGFNWGGMR